MRRKRPHPTDRLPHPFRNNDRPDLSRPRHAIRRPLVPPAADGVSRNARQVEVRRFSTRAPKSAAAETRPRDEPLRRLTGLPAPCLAAGSLRKSPSASPNARPTGRGPLEPSHVATHRPAATASLAKGPPSLGRMPERAEARSSGRTTRSVTRPLGRPAFRRVHQRSRRATGGPARFRRNGSSDWIA